MIKLKFISSIFSKLFAQNEQNFRTNWHLKKSLPSKTSTAYVDFHPARCRYLSAVQTWTLTSFEGQVFNPLWDLWLIKPIHVADFLCSKVTFTDSGSDVPMSIMSWSLPSGVKRNRLEIPSHLRYRKGVIRTIQLNFVDFKGLLT